MLGSVYAEQTIVFFDNLVETKDAGNVLFCYPTGSPTHADFELEMSLYIRKEVLSQPSSSRFGISFDSHSTFYDVPMSNAEDPKKPIRITLRGKSGLKGYGFDPEVLMQKGVFVGALVLPVSGAYVVDKIGLDFTSALTHTPGAADTCRALLKEQGGDTQDEPRTHVAWGVTIGFWLLIAILCLAIVLVAIAISRRLKARAAQIDAELSAQEALEAGNGADDNAVELQNVPQYVANSPFQYVPLEPASPDELPQYAQIAPTMYTSAPQFGSQPVYYSIPYTSQPAGPSSYGY
jgi:hypothetical protein